MNKYSCITYYVILRQLCSLSFYAVFLTFNAYLVQFP